MSSELHLERLLRWRFERAERHAPPPPRAAHLLQLARPWWELWPERFQAYIERLDVMQPVYGHAMSDAPRDRSGFPVPALMIGGADDREMFARMLYLSIREGRLRLRFQLDTGGAATEPALEITFVSDAFAQPVLSATGTLSMGNEYTLNADISAELEALLTNVRVTDRMPFRLIMHATAIAE